MATRRTKRPVGSRAVIYVRVSTDQQAEEGVSLDDQRSRLAAYCEAHKLEVVAVVADEGQSAFKPLSKRPGGKRVLELVRRKQVDAVVILRLDRGFRNTRDALENIEAWDKGGVALCVAEFGGGSLDTRGAMGKMIATMFAAIGEFERNLAAERTTSAMTHMAKSGNMRLGKHPPFGWKYEGNSLVEVPAEQAAIVRCRVLRATGLTLAATAAELAKLGHRNRAGSRFAPSQIQRMLDGSVRQMHAAQ